MPSPQIPTQYAIPCPPLVYPCKSSDQHDDFDVIAATIFEQLNHLEALVHKHYRPSNPYPPPTAHHDANPSTHITAHPMIYNTRIDPMVPTTKSDINESNPVLQSTPLPDLTTPYHATSTYSPTMNPIQRDRCNINHQQDTKTTGTTAIRPSSPDPTSQVPASPTPHLPNNETMESTWPCQHSLHYQRTHNVVLTPGYQKPEPNWPTFACWCQQHAVTTPHIQHVIIHSKMEIFHFLLSTSTRTTYANKEYMTDSVTNRIHMDPPTQTYGHINDPNTYSLFNSHLPVLQTP